MDRCRSITASAQTERVGHRFKAPLKKNVRLAGHSSAEEMATMTVFATTHVGEPDIRPGPS
jgi:hypothetical protein